MADTCPTVRIVNPQVPDGFTDINASDFDKTRHVIYDEVAAKKAKADADAKAKSEAAAKAKADADKK